MRVSRYASTGKAADEAPAWPAWVPMNQRRRQDPLARQACALVATILADGRPLSDETAIVVATSYGSVESTCRFVSGIAQFGDAGASPTPFTTSVHNSCAGALGEFLGLHGPAVTISHGSTSGIAALRWASLMIASQRAPAVLIVVGDRHTAWSRGMVSALSGCPWTVADGAAAVLIEPGTGPGRSMRMGRHPAALVLDGGALIASDEQYLAGSSLGAARLVAPVALGGWWPCCMLAAVPWQHDGSVQLREVEAGYACEAWLGPLDGADLERHDVAGGTGHDNA